MVKKTKEAAELTKQAIIEAARRAFVSRGVSRTSVEQIAEEAGLTRGAVYWHFKNKVELFYAMRQQVFLPLIDFIDASLMDENQDNPLERIEEFLLARIRLIQDDEATRQVYDIMITKCEYVDDFKQVHQNILENCSVIVEKFRFAYLQAQQKGQLRANVNVSAVAMDTYLFFAGLIRLWLQDAGGTILRFQAEQIIKEHIDLRRA